MFFVVSSLFLPSCQCHQACTSPRHSSFSREEEWRDMFCVVITTALLLSEKSDVYFVVSSLFLTRYQCNPACTGPCYPFECLAEEVLRVMSSPCLPCVGVRFVIQISRRMTCYAFRRHHTHLLYWCVSCHLVECLPKTVTCYMLRRQYLCLGAAPRCPAERLYNRSDVLCLVLSSFLPPRLCCVLSGPVLIQRKWHVVSVILSSLLLPTLVVVTWCDLGVCCLVRKATPRQERR